jgi:hypothetical protein
MLKAQRKNKSGHDEVAQAAADTHDAQAMSVWRSPGALGVGYQAGPAVSLAPRVQARLQVGSVNDPYEREADNVADRVTARESAPPISRIQPGSLTGQREAEPEAEDDAAQAKCSACDSEAAQRVEEPAQREEDEAQAKCSACGSEEKVQAKPEPVVAQAACEQCDTAQKAPAPAPAPTPAVTPTPAAPAAKAAEDQSNEQGPAEDESEPAGDSGSGGEEVKEEEEEPVNVPGAVDEETDKPGCGDETAPEPKAGEEDAEGGKAAKPERLNPSAADVGCGEEGGKPEADPEPAAEAAGGGEKKSCGSPSNDSGGDEDAESPDASASPAEKAPQPDQSVPGCGDAEPEADKSADPAPEAEQTASGAAPAAAPTAADAPKASAACAAQKRSLNEDVHDSGKQGGNKKETKKPAMPSKAGGMKLDDAEARIHRRGSGEPLPATVKGRMESSMGVDLSPVRVHSDANAHAASKALKAKAFTHKQHIFLGAGQSKHDVGLMAHETTHALQQGAVERKPPGAAEAKKAADAKLPSDAKRPADGKPPAEAMTPADKAKAQIKPAAAEKAPGLRPAEAAGSLGKPKPASTAMEAARAKPPEHGPVDASKKSDTPEHSEKPPVPPMALKHEAPKEKEKPKAAAPSPASPLAVAGKTAANNAAPTEAVAPPKAGARASAAPGAPETVAADSEPAAAKAAKMDPESDPRFQGTIRRLHATAHRERDHVPPQDKVDEAKAAVKAPPEEPRSHAANDNVTAMAAGAEAAPVPKEKTFEDTLNEKLESIRPKNMEQTLEFKESGAAGKLKQAVGTEIKAQKNTTVGPLEKATVAPLPVGKYPNPKEKKLEPEPADPAMRSLHAENVLPEAKPEEEVSVDKDKDEADRLMKENDLDEDQLKRANEPQFTAVIEAKQKLDENSAKVVPAYRQEEAKQLNQGAKEVARASGHALGGMRGKRKGAKDKVLSKQEAAKKKEEEERKTVVGNVNSKFAATQSLVKARLDGLDVPVGVLFDVAEMVARQKFEDKVDQLMSAYKDDRYDGVRGKARWAWDKLTGMPKEVDQFYVEGTKVYIASMKEAFRNIAKFVDAQLALAKNDITEGKKKINEYLAGLSGKQKEWGDQAFTAIEGDFEALVSSVEDKKQGLASDLVQRYKKSREALDERIDELKAENAGLLSKLVAFIKKVVAVLKKLKDLAVLLMKVGGSVLRGIIKDPSGFLGNLVDAVKSGFSMFGEHIGKHLRDALVGFVTGNLKDVGVSASGESGPSGIGGIILQVLGLSPAQMKEKVAIKLGIRDPSVLDKAWSAVKTLFTNGASALWGKIKETAGDIREKVETEMKEWIGFQIVKAGLKWIVSLFSPVSALLRAIKMIYDVMNFFVSNLDRIIDLVNGVLTSITAVVAGNIAAAAKFIENAAAKGLSLMLGFLASLLGLSGVGAKMQGIVQRVRSVVDRAVDRVLNALLAPFRWVARKGAPLVARGRAAAKRAGAKVKGVAAKVARFLFPQRVFSAEDETHRLFFEGEGSSAQLMMESRKVQLRTHVKQLRRKPENKQGAGKAALDAVDKQLERIAQAKKAIDKSPRQVKTILTSAQSIIANKMKFVILSGKFATKRNPLPIKWFKSASADYKEVYLGPRMPEGRRVERDELKDAHSDHKKKEALFSRLQDRILKAGQSDKDLVKWEKDGMPITEYKPHGYRKIPGSGESLGIDSEWRTKVGRKIQMPEQKPPKSPGGKKINDELRPFGYYAGLESLDGDHVTEIQVGGIDDLKNLWPLKSGENRSGGGQLADSSYELPGGGKVTMAELKQRARTGPSPPQVWLKIASTK